MSTTISFVPPPWVAALLIRPPPPPPITQPRAPPSPMRDLVAQWLVYVTDETTATYTQTPHVLSRFRGWLALVFRLPTFVRRTQTPIPEQQQQQQLPTAQFSVIERSLYFSSTINNDDDSITTPQPKPIQQPSNPKKQRSNIVIEETTCKPTSKLSPLYKSLYFSIAESEEHPHDIPLKCDSPATSADLDAGCVQSFFLTDATGEGKGILDGLREMKGQSTEPQRKRAWVPAVVSLILIALNPLK